MFTDQVVARPPGGGAVDPRSTGVGWGMHHVHGALWRLASLSGAAQQAGPCRSGNVLHRQADRR